MTYPGYSLVTRDCLYAHDYNMHGLNPYMIHDHVAPGDSLPWSEVTSGHGSGDCTQHVVIIGPASYGEYDNSASWHRANHRWLEENYGQWLVTVGRSTHDGLALALKVGSVVPTDLLATLNGLDDYPVICESTLSEVEMELEDESWDCWASDDLRSDLLLPFARDAYDTMSDLLDSMDEGTLRDLFYRCQSALGVYGFAETSCSWVWSRHDWKAIVAAMLAVLSGAEPCPVCAESSLTADLCECYPTVSAANCERA